MGAAGTTVGNIKAAPLKYNGNGVNNTASLSFTLGTHGYRLFIKPLFSLKKKLAFVTFILINGHVLASPIPPLYLTSLASIVQLPQPPQIESR